MSSMKKSALILLLATQMPLICAATDGDPELTFFGAEAAGNEAGTIPPWTGGIVTPPSSYKPGDWHPDPFAKDPVLFTIDHTNAEQYKDQLSAGHRALMEKYPDSYRLHIYPTQRSVSYPPSIEEHTRKYKGKAKVVDDGAGITGIVRGIPFPRPENGEQAIWNMRLSYKGGGYRGYFTTALTASNGAYELGISKHEIEYMYGDQRTTLENFDNVKTRAVMYALRPAKSAGNMYLYHFLLNSRDEERRNWSYNAGKRRVKRSSMIPHDQPMGGSDGIHVWDQGDMWLGPITEFNWRLIGKQEMYVPYNAYKLHSGDTEIDAIITPQHINQDLARYELHRVWVVEATRREDSTHFYKRRRYFIDEDSWRVMLAEHYDDDGQVHRFSEAHHINYYEARVFYTTLDTYYKIDSNRYYLRHVDNQYSPFDFSYDQNANYYKPGRLKMKAKR
ncbi:MAG: DUF1329 domain-containing protein [Gammaproteobacteria bacterium]|nr:MAG: DUF1329 domain-containing protein [Gammaproteobacteria bacterium]RLA51433.1 MAG: DUF1329 domain-containing protein [Gammaproteobacteria bacterium]